MACSRVDFPIPCSPSIKIFFTGSPFLQKPARTCPLPHFCTKKELSAASQSYYMLPSLFPICGCAFLPRFHAAAWRFPASNANACCAMLSSLDSRACCPFYGHMPDSFLHTKKRSHENIICFWQHKGNSIRAKPMLAEYAFHLCNQK